MKHKTGLLVAAVLALALLGTGARSAASPASGGLAAFWASVVKAPHELAQKLSAVLGTHERSEADSSIKDCGSIACPANYECCPGCFGGMVCVPKRAKGECVVECPGLTAR